MVRFFLVSGLNTLFGYGIFALLLYAGMPHQLALLLSVVAGIIFNFNTIGRLVFRSHDGGLIFKFIAVYLVTYLLTLGFLWWFKQLEINYYIGAAIIFIPMGILAYMLQKRFVFRQVKMTAND